MSTEKSLVSVVIPHYKNTSFTLQAVKSVLNQKSISISQVQIIISIDGPITVKDQNKVKSLSSNISLITNHSHEGPGGNRQSGLSIAKGKYVVFLDSDDQLESEFLVRSISVLRPAKTFASVCFSKPIFESGFSLVDRTRLLPLMAIRDISLVAGHIFNHGNVFPSAFYLCQLSHMMFKASVLRDFEFNYDYRRGGEDWDLIAKTLRRGKIKIIPKKLLKFRYSPQSSTSSKLNRRLKWQSYLLLNSRLSIKNKQGIFHQLFLFYIRLFKAKSYS